MLDLDASITTRDKIMFGLSLAAAVACALAVIAQLGAGSFFLLELYLSLLPKVLFVSAAITIATLFWHRRLAAGLAALTFIAAQPFVFFNKFEPPTGATCGENECLNVLTINIWGESEYIEPLTELIAEYEIDIVAINESPEEVTEPRFKDAHFADFDTVIHADWLTMPRGMGNPISFFARDPIDDYARILNRDTGRRAYIAADLADPWQDIRIVMAHAMTPTSPSRLSQRNALIDHVSEVAQDAESYIVMGDFNTTPWSPNFAALPGKRAGDPRFSSTWPTAIPWLGLSIDHIMFSEDLELVEFKVLQTIGSDHFPVMAVFKRKDG